MEEYTREQIQRADDTDLYGFSFWERRTVQTMWEGIPMVAT